jgi:hypothetical protein
VADPTDYPAGLVVRALERLDVTFPGVTEWREVVRPRDYLTEATAHHYHSGPGTQAGRVRIGDLTPPEAVALAEQVYQEAGWSVRILAGKCSCGLGFRTPPDLTRPGAS